MRMIKSLSTLVLFTSFAALTAACVIKDDDDDDTGGDHAGDVTDDGSTDGDDGSTDGDDGTITPDAPPSTGSVAPSGGTWFYAQVTETASTCGSAIGRTPAGDFSITSVTGSSFHVIEPDSTFDCTFSSSGFDCPDRALATEDLGPSYDAVITGHATASGTFDRTTHGTGTQVATFSCSGSDCAALAAATGAHVPCSATVTFVIAKR